MQFSSTTGNFSCHLIMKQGIQLYKLTVLCIYTEPRQLLGWSLKFVKNSEVIWSFSRKQPTSRLSHSFLLSSSFFPGENCFSVSRIEGRMVFNVCLSIVVTCAGRLELVIILTNHISYGKADKPVRSRSWCMQPVKSAGKRVRARHDWFRFDFWLVKCQNGVGIQPMKSCNNASTANCHQTTH